MMIGRHADPATGLNNLQRRLLKTVAAEWCKMARIVGDAMYAGHEQNDSASDMILQAELEAMARANDPLIEIEGSGAMRYCSVRLTDRGLQKQTQLSAS